jgi:hypothetical protein
MVSLAAPTTVALPPAAMSAAQNGAIRWVAPAPTWDSSPGPVFQRPFVAEFKQDSFMPDFLNMMAGNSQQPGLNTPETNMVNDPTNPLYKLFQPLHQRYYLVTASLVCRKLGLPDRTVDRKNGEKVSFVLRRLVTQTTPPGQPQQYAEMAWVEVGDNKGWNPLLDDKTGQPVPLRKDEERLPLHPVKYCPFVAAPGSSTGGSSPSKPCQPRVVYHGYIPVDKREKYLMSYSMAAIQNNIASSGVDPRLDQVTTQVIDQWRALYIDPITGEALSDGQNLVFEGTPLQGKLSTAEQARRQKLRYQMSLYLIEDLAEFLKTYLLDIFNAVINSTSTVSPTSYQNLLDLLNTTMINKGTKSLAQAIRDVQDPNLVSQVENDPFSTIYDVATTNHGGSSIVPPSSTFLVLQSPTKPEGLLHQRFREALGDSTTQFTIADDLAQQVKNEPTQGDIFVTRLVYERGVCDPIISQPSAYFIFAKVFDTDAPARKIRIEMPSIGLKDLRKHKRGVAFQLPPDLNNLLNRVNSGMLKGGGLADAGAPLGIAMICTFSIPIITICALIVLFIFLILLNIIFWWLPFIRICFPIPESK